MDKNDSSAQSAVYNALRSNIMYLKLKPGTVISAKEIAEKLGIQASTYFRKRSASVSPG